MIDWNKPLQYLWDSVWEPAKLVYTCRHNLDLKLLVVQVGNSDYAKWATGTDSCVRNTPKKHVRYLHLRSDGSWNMYCESEALPAHETVRCTGCRGSSPTASYTCRKIEWE